jgi:hypothetical protein
MGIITTLNIANQLFLESQAPLYHPKSFGIFTYTSPLIVVSLFVVIFTSPLMTVCGGVFFGGGTSSFGFAIGSGGASKAISVWSLSTGYIRVPRICAVSTSTALRRKEYLLPVSIREPVIMT